MKITIIITMTLIFSSFCFVNGQGVMGKKFQVSYNLTQHPVLGVFNTTQTGGAGLTFSHTPEIEYIYKSNKSLILQADFNKFYSVYDYYNNYGNYVNQLQEVHSTNIRFGRRVYRRGDAPFGAYTEGMISYFRSQAENSVLVRSGFGIIWGTGIQWVIKEKFTIRAGYNMSFHFSFKDSEYLDFNVVEATRNSYYLNTYIGAGMFIF